MTIFSTDVNEVRIAGTILIFSVSIIGAAIPIAVARIWGNTNSKNAAANAALTTAPDGRPLTRAERRKARKDAAIVYHKKQQILKLIQHLFLALGAGVIVATAMMHMLPEGTESVAEGYAGLQGEAAEDDHADHAHRRAFVVMDATIAADATTVDDHVHDDSNSTDGNATDDHDDHDDHDHDGNTTDPDHDHADDDHDGEGDAGEHSHGFNFGYLFVILGLFITFVVESEMHRAIDAHDGHDHSHGAPSGAPPSAPLAHAVVALTLTPLEVEEAKAEEEYQRAVAATVGLKAKARLMEVAVATHSVIIGIAFGTSTKASAADTLALALIFHQLCEGFAVGAIFEAAFRAPPVKRKVGSSKTAAAMIVAGSEEENTEQQGGWFARNARHLSLAFFVLIFAMCVPIGIIIGIIISESTENPDSSESLFARGALECFAGGVLIYVGCVEFLGGLFGAHSHSHLGAIPDDCSDAEEEAEMEAREAVDGPLRGLRVATAVAALGDTDSDEANVDARAAAKNEDTLPHAVDTPIDGTLVADDGDHGRDNSPATGNADDGDEHTCDHHHHSHDHPNGHFLETDSLTGRIATYTLVFIGAAAMTILSKWA